MGDSFPDKWLGEAAAIGTAVLWTLSTLAWTSAGRHVGALAVSFIRLLLTCLFLAPYEMLARGSPLPPDADARTWWLLCMSGLCGFFLGDVCLFKAFLVIGPRLSLLAQPLVPPVVAVISWIVLGDPLSLRQWVAMFVTLAGVVWVVLEKPDEATHCYSRQQLATGLLLAMLSVVGQAVGWILSKQAIGQYDAVSATYIRVIGAIGGYVVLVTLLARWQQMLLAMRNLQAMMIMTAGSLVGPFLGVIFSLEAVRRCHAGVVTTIVATMPVLILPLVVVFYREKVSLRAVVGAIVSVLGVALLVL